MTKDVRVVTLTMNPALDLSTTVAEIVPFKKLRCTTVRRDPGGGGINVARVVRRLGGHGAAIFPVGGPAGEALAELVAAEGVESVTVPIAADTREDFTVFETGSGKQFRFVAPGPVLGESEWQRCCEAFFAAAAGADFAVVSGSLPPGMTDAFFGEIARRAREANIRLVLDTTGAGLKAGLAEGLYLAKPNQGEFAELMGVETGDMAAMAEAARRLVGEGRVEAVALTLAESGALLVTRELCLKARAPQVVAVSTVGAGDSFLGAMVWALAAGRDWTAAFRLGVAAGSAALLSTGTDLAHPEAIHRLEAEVRVETCL